MGLRRWWRENREKAEVTRRSVALNSDQRLIAEQVPELTGMNDVEGMAYVMQQIQQWNAICTEEQAATLAGRLKASNESFEADGLAMPYWGNLWVLRTYQRSLGFDVPAVAPPGAHSFEKGQAFGRDALAALDQFIESQIAPRRNAFLAVFEAQLAKLDERLTNVDGGLQATREELAGVDYQVLLENWRERRKEQTQQALLWLSDQVRQAEAIGCGDDYREAIESALSRQEAILTSDALQVLLHAV